MHAARGVAAASNVLQGSRLQRPAASFARDSCSSVPSVPSMPGTLRAVERKVRSTLVHLLSRAPAAPMALWRCRPRQSTRALQRRVPPKKSLPLSASGSGLEPGGCGRRRSSPWSSASLPPSKYRLGALQAALSSPPAVLQMMSSEGIRGSHALSRCALSSWRPAFRSLDRRTTSPGGR